MIDACWVVRPGEDHAELAHSIRSVDANLPIRSVTVAGHKPWWLNCRHLSTLQDDTAQVNALRNLRAILACEDLTQTVALFNDDFYVMAPLDRLPLLHRGPLRAAIQERPIGSARARALQDTADLLQRLGIRDPLSYDLHTPGVFHRSELAETLDLIAAYTDRWDPDRGARILWKTVHGNLWPNHHATYSPDVKIRDLTAQPWPSPLLSTIDLAFTYGAVGRHIRSMFPTPSRYEATQ